MTIFVLFGMMPVKAATLSTDGSSGDVASKIASAKAGDTVTLPAGEFTWNSPVVVTKGITLSGVPSTPAAQSCGTLTTHIIRSSGFPGGTMNPLVTIQPSSDVPVTVSSLWLDNKAQKAVSWDNKVSILIKGPDTGSIPKQIRITNCFFDSGTQVVWWIGGAYGVVDHCKFANCWVGVMLYGGNNDLGDAAWARNDWQAGNLNSVFTEDCTFIWNMTGGSGNPGSPWVTYHWAGGRSVIRHCLIDGTGANNGITGPVDCHGNQTYWKSGANNQRGTIRFEFYDNTVKLGGSIYQVMDLRGGSHFIHDNTFTTKDQAKPNLGDFRDEESDPHNTPGVPLRSPVKWPCEDQISASFIWGNTLNGAPYNKVAAGKFGNPSTTSGDPFYIKENRDYWLSEPGSDTATDYPAPGAPSSSQYPSPYASLQTTSYTPAPYPHPLAGGSAPEPTPAPTATPSPSGTPRPPRPDRPTPTPTPATDQTWEKWLNKQNEWIRANPPEPD
jgi:hypothetical protein